MKILILINSKNWKIIKDLMKKEKIIFLEKEKLEIGKKKDEYGRKKGRGA